MSRTHICGNECLGIYSLGQNRRIVHVFCYDLSRRILVDPRFERRMPNISNSTATSRPRAIAAYYRRYLSVGSVRRLDVNALDLIDNIVNRAIDDLVMAGPGGDYIQHVAERVPVELMVAIMGLDASLSNLIGIVRKASAEGEQDARETVVELSRIFREEIAAVDRPSASDGAPTIDLIAHDVSMGRTSLDEGTAIATQLFLGGTLTPRSMNSHALVIALANAWCIEYLYDDAVSSAVIDELLRFRTYYRPDDLVRGFFRYPTTPMQVGTVEVSIADVVVVDTRRSNFDVGQFVSADKFIIDTNSSRNMHLSFGWGRGRCPGESIARSQLVSILKALFFRIPTVQLLKDDPEVLTEWPGGQLRELLIRW